jgi:hypothetical protein
MRRRDGLVAGLALGAAAAATWIAADAAGYGYGLGFVGAADGTRVAVESGSALPFQLWLALGVIAAGAALGERRLRLPDAACSARGGAGGLLMGAGGSLAHGCNIGHGLTGLPLPSLARRWPPRAWPPPHCSRGGCCSRRARDCAAARPSSPHDRRPAGRRARPAGTSETQAHRLTPRAKSEAIRCPVCRAQVTWQGSRRSNGRAARSSADKVDHRAMNAASNSGGVDCATTSGPTGRERRQTRAVISA